MTPILWSLLAAIASFGVGLLLLRLQRRVRRRRAERAYRAVVDQAERARVLRSVVATDYRKFTRKP